MNTMNMIIFIAEAAGVVVLSILYIKSQLPKQTIENYKELVQSQDGRIKTLEDNDRKKGKAIAKLQGQVEVYKDLPLEKIADTLEGTLKTQGEIIKTQKEIIDLVRKAKA